MVFISCYLIGFKMVGGQTLDMFYSSCWRMGPNGRAQTELLPERHTTDFGMLRQHDTVPTRHGGDDGKHYG